MCIMQYMVFTDMFKIEGALYDISSFYYFCYVFPMF